MSNSTIQETRATEHLALGYRLNYGTVATENGQRHYAQLQSPQQRTNAFRARARGLYWFSDLQTRNAALDQLRQIHAAKIAKRQTKLNARAAARDAWNNPYQVNEVLHSSWGYEQTNVEFFQVLEVRDRSLKIQQIEQETRETGFMSGPTTAQPGKFIGEPKWVTIQISSHLDRDGKPQHSVPSPIHGRLYRGSLTQSCSWYG